MTQILRCINEKVNYDENNYNINCMEFKKDKLDFDNDYKCEGSFSCDLYKAGAIVILNRFETEFDKTSSISMQIQSLILFDYVLLNIQIDIGTLKCISNIFDQKNDNKKQIESLIFDNTNENIFKFYVEIIDELVNNARKEASLKLKDSIKSLFSIVCQITIRNISYDEIRNNLEEILVLPLDLEYKN
eukprot:416576_1